MKNITVRSLVFVAGLLAMIVTLAPRPAAALVSPDNVVDISRVQATQICNDLVAPLNASITALQQQVYGMNSQPISAPPVSYIQPVGGFPDTSNFEARLATLEKTNQEQAYRIQQLEQRTGSLEMALDYFNGWVGKFKVALKIK